MLIQSLIFLALSAVIIIFTRKLAVSGKRLADLSPFSGHFISFTLFALVTSMPELVMSISSVLIIHDPNLSAGNIFGSNFLNLTIIAALEIILCRGAFIASIQKSNKNLILSQFTLAIVPALFLVLPAWDMAWLRLSPASFLIIGGYLYFTRQVPSETLDEEDKKESEGLSLKQVFMRFSFQAFVIILAAIQLTRTCDQISNLTGLGNSFLGALLLAGVSSLPEIVLCFSLVRMGHGDMALGNILGSNFFNLTILVVADLCMAESLYRHLSAVHMIPFTAIGVITLILLGTAGGKKKAGYVAGWLIAVSYVAGMYLLYRFA